MCKENLSTTTNCTLFGQHQVMTSEDIERRSHQDCKLSTVQFLTCRIGLRKRKQTSNPRWTGTCNFRLSRPENWNKVESSPSCNFSSGGSFMGSKWSNDISSHAGTLLSWCLDDFAARAGRGNPDWREKIHINEGEFSQNHGRADKSCDRPSHVRTSSLLPKPRDITS
jgi:hypothetical protein